MLHRTFRRLFLSIAITIAAMLLLAAGAFVLFSPHPLPYREQEIAVTQTSEGITITYTGQGAAAFNASTEIDTGVMTVSGYYTLWDRYTGQGGTLKTSDKEAVVIQFRDPQGVYPLWEADPAVAAQYRASDHTSSKA